MIVLGLTGSIAMGKSTIGAMMRDIGIPVHESDHAAHELLQPHSIARPALIAAFPYSEFPQIYEEKTKDIKRSALGALVFNNKELRERLESIIHPLVQKSQNDFIQENTLKGAKIICLDIPLLFETGAEKRVDYTITVSAPYNIQRERALSRAHMTEEKFEAILKQQMPDAEKCKRSDFVINTGIALDHSMQELKNILREIKHDT